MRDVLDRVRLDSDLDRVRVGVLLLLPLPKLHADTSLLPSLRESAPGMPSIAVLTVGA